MRAGPAGRVCLFRLPECVQRLWKAAGQTGGGSIINAGQRKQKSRRVKIKKEGSKGEEGEIKKQRIMAVNVYLVSGYWCESLSVPGICKGTVMSCPTA